MRKLGIIGGTSWNSTALYYRYINEGVARALGGLHSAPLMIESIDLAPYAALQRAGRTDEAEALIVAAGERLAAGGAEAILIASNTTNRYGPAVIEATGLPLLHIADPTIARLKADGRRRIALFGTRHVMTESFARERYEAAGLEVMALRPDWIDQIDRIIFDELVQGRVSRSSQRELKTMITELDKQRAEAIVLGCTELCLAVDARANVMPVYDTTQLHAQAAVQWLLEGVEMPSKAA
ncbi:aspartate/glutamate racemase family protein [Sphingomicrobium aestuariivivum]|uniref:aspartate/glutamate racemase family protein n=1 Tax=Sphingomicrobium aestuariivivum TaxID=1582356 RepID=UPI001FD6C411|nr:amino acid racemase [Sphingomicrobium aestuariivivum]MCJ8192011.1 amino acid racemase [Sphingomicrobium aestuariivivum]